MQITVPKHNHWIKCKANEVTEKFKELECEIIEENNDTITIKVPDSWYFTTDNKTYLTAYLDEERTQPIFKVKERISTGTFESVFDVE